MTSTCPKCKKLKEYLRSAAIDCEEVDMSTPESLTELRVNGVFTTMAPALQVRDMNSFTIEIKEPAEKDCGSLIKTFRNVLLLKSGN